MRFFRYKILAVSILATALIVALKFLLHVNNLEVLTSNPLQRSAITGTFFVIGFLLSSTMSDYKESERIPAKFSSIIESMYEDARSIHANYKKFDLKVYRDKLRDVAMAFITDVRKKKHSARLKIYELNDSFSEMEKLGVPPNYIVKLKQQQSQLAEISSRVMYIQRIKSIPSSTTLLRSIIPLSIFLMLFTEIEPYYGGLAILAIISFIFIYILLLINLIQVPFRAEGKTRDDVSLFLVDETVKHLSANK